MHKPLSTAFPSQISLLIFTALLALGTTGLPREAAAQGTTSPVTNGVAKVSQQQAEKAALAAVPGKVTDVSIEKKRGKNVYVVEVVADDGGDETDVLVDMESGKVLGTEK